MTEQVTHLDFSRSRLLPVSEKNTPPENHFLGSISLTNTESGAGEQCLPLDCMAEDPRKGMFFSQTPVSPHPSACARACLPVRFPVRPPCTYAHVESIGAYLDVCLHAGTQAEIRKPRNPHSRRRRMQADMHACACAHIARGPQPG